jgi:hypothetical protein
MLDTNTSAYFAAAPVTKRKSLIKYRLLVIKTTRQTFPEAISYPNAVRYQFAEQASSLREMV